MPAIPWVLHEVAGRQTVILSASAGFIVTAIVLVITLAREQPASPARGLDSVVELFLVAWLSLATAAVMYSRLPREDYAGPEFQRVHYALANDAYLRAIVLVVLGMLPLLRLFRLDDAFVLFAGMSGFLTAAGAVVAAIVIGQLGLFGWHEAAIGLVVCLAGGVAAALLKAATGIVSTDATATLAGATVVLTGSDLLATMAAPVVVASSQARARVLSLGRALVRWDYVGSVAVLTFYWLFLTDLV